MKRFRAAALLFTVFFLWVPSVFAATITYTGNYSGPTDVTDRLLEVQKFDPSMGALLSATFDLTATMTTQAFATNDGDFYAGWDKLTYEFSLGGTGSYNDVAISASNAATRIVGSGDPVGTFAFSSPGGGEYARIVGQQPWTYIGPTLTDTDIFTKSALSEFIGMDFLSFYLTTVNYDTLAVLGLQTGGQPNPAPFGLSTQVSAEVTATYEYNPGPIPGAVWLFASGLLGLAGLRKRFQR